MQYRDQKILLTPLVYLEEEIETLALLEHEGLTYQCNAHQRTYTEDELIEALQGFDAVVIDEERVTRKVIEACPELKLISTLNKDTSKVDLRALEDHDVELKTTQKAETQALADLSFAMLLALARDLKAEDNHLHVDALAKDVWGETIGIIGFGEVGQAVAERAWGFNMDVIYVDPYHEKRYPFSQEVNLETLFKNADFISIHPSFNPETFQMIDHSSFEQMEKKPIIINTSHPEIINTPALYHALTEGVIAGAGFSEKGLVGMLGEEIDALDHVITYSDEAVETENTATKQAKQALKNIVKHLERQ